MKRLLLLYILLLLVAINTTAQTNYNTYTVLEGDARFEIKYPMSATDLERFTSSIKNDLKTQRCDWVHVTGSRSSSQDTIILDFYVDANTTLTPRECVIPNSRMEALTVRQDYQMEFPEYGYYHYISAEGETFLVHYPYYNSLYIYDVYSSISQIIQNQSCDWLNIVEYGITSRQSMLFKFRAAPNTGLEKRQCYILGQRGDLIIEQSSPNTPPKVYNVWRGVTYTMPGLRSRVTLSGSETGVTYNFYNSGEMIGSVQGTGKVLEFYVSDPGVYTAKAVKNSFIVDMSGSAELVTHPLLDSKWWGPQPASATLSRDGESIKLTFTADWKYYDNSYSGYSRLKSDVEWLVAKLNNGEVSGWDPHFKITKVNVNGGSAPSAYLTIEAGPNIYSSAKNSRFCTDANSGKYFDIQQNKGGSIQACNLLGEEKIPFGGSGTITLSSRQPQVTYQLYRDGVLCSNTLNSGNAFTDLRQYGEYRVKGTFKSSSKWMNGEFRLQPDIWVSEIQGGGILAGNTPVIITLPKSQTQVAYQLLRNGGIVEERAGTGSPMTFSVTNGGTYTIRGCYGGYDVAMSGEAKVIPRNEIVSADRNYISVRTYTASGGAKSYLDVTYHDGLGYPVQSIQTNATGSMSNGQNNNIITPVYYDNTRRDNAREYLPFVSVKSTAEFETDPFVRQNAYYSAPERFGSDESGYTYAERNYEPSPLNRVREQYNVGAVFRRNSKKSTFGYQANAAGEVWKFTITLPAGTLIRATTGYAAGTLYKTTFTNEDGTRSETFTDFQDRVVLERVHDGTGNLDTYHVYDDLGRLGYVIPPEAVARWDSESADVLVARYCYKYVYDGRDRMVERQLPGKEVEYMVYDKGDRMVLSQDGNARVKKQWIYTTYDNLNRVVAQDIVKNENMSLQEIRTWADGTEFNARYPLSWHAAGTRKPTPDSRFSHVRVLSESRYGGYKYSRSGSSTPAPFQYPAHLAYRDAWGGDTLLNAPDTRVFGLKVYDKIYLLEGDDAASGNYIERAYYHDYRSRVIQTVEKNHLGGTSRVSLEYDFTGNTLSRHESHQKAAGATADVLVKHCVYDSRGRLLSDSTRLNNTGNWAVVTYDYDELGRLSGKTYGSGVNAVTETLEYNIQGWLTGLSNPRFSMKLRYFDAVKAPAASYTGNIVEWEWKHGTSTPDMYAFTYDALSRLTDAGHYSLSGTTWNVATDKFTEQGISYDLHGNIKTLQRVAAGVLTDNLAYSYTGNQLTSLAESVRSTSTADIYAPGSVPTGSYTYDGNGNMVADSRRGLTLGYNYLNLLWEVKAGSTVRARYIWLTDGSKLQVRDAGNNGFDYLGSLIYKNGNAGLQLETASFGEGVIRASVSTGGGMEVNYFLTDHLGSVRVIVNGNGVVQERNDYYPFGARHVRGDYPQLATNRFKYTGKEEQMTGDLKYLDYGWRMYDSGLGRWFGLDLMAEKYYSWSPYHYCLVNPIKNIDPDGNFVSTHTDWFGNVVAVYNDGDLGVYRHSEKYLKGWDPLKSSLTTIGAEYMGETAYWDEFISPETGEIMSSTRIWFKTSFDPILEFMHSKTQTMNLKEIALNSRSGKAFDIKKDFSNIGALLNGKYATSRSAGNFLAGYNAQSGTIMGLHFSFNTFQKLAGALHIENSNGKELSKAQMIDIVLFGNYSSSDKRKFKAPTWGEVMYQYRMSKMGWNYGKNK